MIVNFPPVGTFDLELDPPLHLSLLSFDVVSTPSTPEISVGVSENGVTFSPASSLALNGYRINAWLVPATVRFVRLTINPTHPDTLGGSVYTFGLTQREWVDDRLPPALGVGIEARIGPSPQPLLEVPGRFRPWTLLLSQFGVPGGSAGSPWRRGPRHPHAHCRHPVPLPSRPSPSGPEPLSIG